MLRVTYPLVYPRQDIDPTVYHLRPRDCWTTYLSKLLHYYSTIPLTPSSVLLNYYSPLILLLILHTREPLIFSGERRAGRKRERYRRKLRVDGQADSDEGRGPSSDLPAAGSAAGPTDINDRSQNISQDLRIQMSLARSRTYEMYQSEELWTLTQHEYSTQNM